jgi:predicted MFS family arabinose efflux permease
VQLGYALGVFLLVPLGDTVQRRRMIPLMMLISAAALIATALSPNFVVLLIAVFVVGASSVTGQILTPLAGDLARPERRGRTVSMVASGLMFGILISRAISGLISDVVGWRAVFLFAAALTIVFASLLARSVPTLTVGNRVPYLTLLRSVLTSVVEYPRLRIFLALGACIMAVFTILWTGLTFLLSAAPYGFSVTQIGLVSLVGVVGALAAQNVGRLYDRGWAVRTIGAGFALTLLAMILIALFSGNFAVALVAVALSSVGIQSVLVLVQTSVMGINPNTRSRLNTIIVVIIFIGGAIGSSLAVFLWQSGGWLTLSSAAVAIALLGLVIWLLFRRRIQQPA